MAIVDFVNGKTKTFMLFGNPVHHSFSPILQNTVAKKVGFNSVYTAMEVNDLESAVKGAFSMGVEGINITVPFKKDVCGYLCDIEKNALSIGAVNTLKYTEKGYVGYNTDILGLSMSLKLRGIEIKDKTVVVLGAGGASAAVVTMALSEGAKRTYIINRTVEKAEKIKENALEFFDGEIICGGYDMLNDIDGEIIMLQTTSVGMGEGVWQSPLKDISIFEKTIALVDMIYNPMKTKIMDDAEKMRVMSINGLDMLIFQGIASFEIWNDIKIDDKTKLDLRNELTVFYERGI